MSRPMTDRFSSVDPLEPDPMDVISETLGPFAKMKNSGGRSKKPNPLSGAERGRRYRRNHKVSSAARVRAWKRKNRSHVNAYQRKYYRNVLKPKDEKFGRGWRERGYWTNIHGSLSKTGERVRNEGVSHDERLKYYRLILKDVQAEIDKCLKENRPIDDELFRKKVILERSLLYYRKRIKKQKSQT